MNRSERTAVDSNIVSPGERSADAQERSHERPIIFSAPMVKAILAGRKTMTRRIIKGSYPGPIYQDCESGEWGYLWYSLDDRHDPTIEHWRGLKCPYGAPGDQLYVRENFRKLENASEHPSEPIWYMADGEPGHGYWTGGKPSIHMPRWASRITLEVTDVRVERLQAITEADAIAEGSQEPSLVPMIGACWSERDAFAKLWQVINGPDAWAVNPWVWVIGFKRIGSAEGVASQVDQQPWAEHPSSQTDLT